MRESDLYNGDLWGWERAWGWWPRERMREQGGRAERKALLESHRKAL